MGEHPVGNKVLIIAGEASGELHGANLVKAMRVEDPSLSFRGVGSHYMARAGVELLRDAAETAVVGLSEVGRHLFSIIRVFHDVRTTLRVWRPDLVILIDYPDFNLLVARRAKRLGIPVLYYISPQIWAWRSGRIKTIRKWVDVMMVILPFEASLYEQAGVKVSFVGHPLLDVVKIKDEAELARRQYACRGEERLVGLLPGSRIGEIRKLLPVLLDSAAILADRIPGLHFLIPLAATIRREQVNPFLLGRDLPVTVAENSTQEIIQICELIIAASGTVTLEAAILGTPMVVVYKVHPLTYWLGKRLIRVRQVALVNIIAGEVLAPELLQDDANPEAVAREAENILINPQRQEWIRARLLDVCKRLGTAGASRRAASIALEYLRQGAG